MKHLIMNFLLSSLLTIFATAASGQTADNTDLLNDKNIYYQALAQYVHFISADSFYSKFPKTDTLYIEKRYSPTDSLIDHIGSTIIVMVEEPYRFLIDRHLKRFRIYRIFPLAYLDGVFSVSLVPFGVSLDKKNKMLRYANGGSFEVKYALIDKQFHFLSIKNYSY